MGGLTEKRLKIEIWTWKRPKQRGIPRMVTVLTDIPGVGGTRIAGPKMLPGDAELTAEFWLDRRAVESVTEDFESLQMTRQETPSN